MPKVPTVIIEPPKPLIEPAIEEMRKELGDLRGEVSDGVSIIRTETSEKLELFRKEVQENALKAVEMNKRLFEVLQNISIEQMTLKQEISAMRSEAISVKNLSGLIRKLRLENQELKTLVDKKRSKELKEIQEKEEAKEMSRLSQLQDEEFRQRDEEEKRLKEESRATKLAIANPPRMSPPFPSFY